MTNRERALPTGDHDRVLTRRIVLGGLGATAVGAGFGLAALRSGIARPEQHGAQAGTVSLAQAQRNTVALRQAMDSGEIVDGGGLFYDIHGSLRANVAPYLRHITLRQRQTDTALEKTFLVDSISTGEVVLLDVTIDMMWLQQTAGMRCSAIQISNCTAATLRDVTVIRGGAITGITIDTVGRAVLDRIEVRDFVISRTQQPSDDVCQGIEFNRCTDFTLRNASVRNMVAQWPGRPSVAREYSRGIVLGQCRDGIIENNSVGPGVEQGIDLTGGINRSITIKTNHVTDAGTWGIKCANRFVDILIQGNEIVRAGSAGIVCSAPSDSSGQQPRNVFIQDNLIVDTGASGLWKESEPVGILVSSSTEALRGTPSGIRAVSNRIIDRQTPPTTVRGLDARVQARNGRDTVWINQAGDGSNLESDNLVSGVRSERSRGWHN